MLGGRELRGGGGWLLNERAETGWWGARRTVSQKTANAPRRIRTMAYSDFMSLRAPTGRKHAMARRRAVLGLLAFGLPVAWVSAASADALSCLPVQRMAQTADIAPANKKIGVSVA